MQAEHVCHVSYRHVVAAFCCGLGHSLNQPSMPIKPRHTLQVASATTAAQSVECQIGNHRQAQHGEIPDAPPNALMDLAAGISADIAS